MQPDLARVRAMELRLEHSHDWGPVYFHGQTMLPFLQEGDLVEVRPVAPASIRLGDVLTYRDLDKFPTRRVVAIRRRVGLVILHGDSIRGHPDFVVRLHDVLGRVESRIRGSRRLGPQDWEWRLATCRGLLCSTLVRFSRYLRRRLYG